MNKIGKMGWLNVKANKKIDKIFIQKDIFFCEARLENCTGGMGLTRAHRHKRIWYRSQPEKLHDFKQVILCCLSCHQKIEKSAEETEELFMKLRGKE